MSVYSQIDQNKWKSFLVVGIFVVFISLVGWVFSLALNDGGGVAITALIFSTIGAVSSYFFSDRLVLSLAGAKKIEENDDPEYFHLVENVAIAAGLPMPKVYLIEDRGLNAFATGRDPKHGVICVTRGLREILSKRELEGVLAHEFSHIGNYDTRLMVITAVLAGVAGIMADLFMRTTFLGGSKSDDEDNKSGILFFILAILTAILAPIGASLIKLAISRNREYLADASSVLLTRNPAGLISALEKISADTRTPAYASEATAHLFIANPFKGKKANFLQGLSRLFETHPPIGERINRLREM